MGVSFGGCSMVVLFRLHLGDWRRGGEEGGGGGGGRGGSSLCYLCVCWGFNRSRFMFLFQALRAAISEERKKRSSLRRDISVSASAGYFW